VSLQKNASAGAEAFNNAYPLGVSSEVPMDKLSTRWTQFAQKKAGVDRYPGTYRHEVYNALTHRWTTLGDTVRTTSARLEMRFICPGCPLKTLSPVTDEQVNRIWSAKGDEYLADNSLDLVAGTTKYLALGMAYAEFDPASRSTPGFVDAKPFTVIASVFKVDAAQTTAPPGVDLDFIARPAGIGGSNPKFRWNFGDGTAALLKTGDSTATYRWTKFGKFNVTVEMSDASGTLVAKAQVVVEISNKASFVWAFETATVQSSTLPAGGIGSTRSDTLVFKKASDWMTALESFPDFHGILIFGRPSGGAKCNAVAFLDRFAAGGRFADTLQSASSLGGIVGSCGGAEYTGNLTLGSLENGALTGLAAAVPSPTFLVLPGGSINATHKKDSLGFTVLDGTFVLNFRYSTGIGTYTVAFRAVRFKPD